MKQLKLTIAGLFMATSLWAQQEVPLNTDVHSLSGMVYKTRANKFKETFVPSAGVLPDYVFETTSYSQLHNLELSLAPESVDYIRVLRILYGFDVSTKKIRLIYIPDKAVKNAQGNFDFKISEYPLSQSSNQIVYMLNNGTFEQKLYKDVAALVSNYKTPETIKVDRYSVPGNQQLDNLSFDPLDANKDAEGITFSFQEINAFVKDAPTVYLTCIRELDEVHGNTFYKHAMAISKYDPSTAATTVEFAANLGALCPLRCKSLQLLHTSLGDVIDSKKNKKERSVLR